MRPLLKLCSADPKLQLQLVDVLIALLQ